MKQQSGWFRKGAHHDSSQPSCSFAHWNYSAFISLAFSYITFQSETPGIQKHSLTWGAVSWEAYSSHSHLTPLQVQQQWPIKHNSWDICCHHFNPTPTTWTQLTAATPRCSTKCSALGLTPTKPTSNYLQQHIPLQLMKGFAEACNLATWSHCKATHCSRSLL